MADYKLLFFFKQKKKLKAGIMSKVQFQVHFKANNYLRSFSSNSSSFFVVSVLKKAAMLLFYG